MESLDVGKPIRGCQTVGIPEAVPTIKWHAEAIDKIYEQVGPCGALQSTAHHVVEPCDWPICQRHLRITCSSMKHSDRTFMVRTSSPKNAEDVIKMRAILFGTDFIETHPVVTGNCNGFCERLIFVSYAAMAPISTAAQKLEHAAVVEPVQPLAGCVLHDLEAAPGATTVDGLVTG